MQAITYDHYGGPEVVQVSEIDTPVAGAGEVLVQVHAASLNPYDFHFMRGEPLFMRMVSGLRRPKFPRLGRDLAGTVVAVGPGVTDFVVGDEVYGGGHGTLAEYCTAKASELARKPDALDWNQAAALPMVSTTGLQAMKKAQLQAGQRVLVNGASGGIGHLLVQMASMSGCHVTAVCKTSNVAWMEELGADRVIDYTRESCLDGEYDVILDMVSNHTVREFLHALSPGGAYACLGAVQMGHVWGPLGRMLRVGTGPSYGRRAFMLDAKYDRETLDEVAGFVGRGMRPRIEQVLSLRQAGEGIGHVERGHTRGKTVVGIA